KRAASPRRASSPSASSRGCAPAPAPSAAPSSGRRSSVTTACAPTSTAPPPSGWRGSWSLLVGVELEAHLELRAVEELPALDLDVELVDLGDAQVAQRRGRGLHGVLRCGRPRLPAGADDLDHLVDGVVVVVLLVLALLGHDCLPEYVFDRLVPRPREPGF